MKPSRPQFIPSTPSCLALANGSWSKLRRFAASVSSTPAVDGAMHVTVTLLKMFSRGTSNHTAPQTPLASNPVHMMPKFGVSLRIGPGFRSEQRQ